MKVLILFVVVALSALAECHERESGDVEARGKGKYALLMHLFYVVATKLFILKIVYGIIFYILLTKGWHFVLWFVQYLKKKEHHVEYGQDYYGQTYQGHQTYQGQQTYQGHQDYQTQYGHYEPPYHGYGSSPYQGYEKKGYDNNKYITTYTQGSYDSDGSYSVQRPVVIGGGYKPN